MIELSPIDERVFCAMYRLRRFATVNRISKVGKISWKSVDSTLQRFEQLGLASKKTVGERKYWVLRF